jgi:hypothetical protein
MKDKQTYYLVSGDGLYPINHACKEKLMSELSKQIKAVQTNVRKPICSPLQSYLSVESEYTPSSLSSIGTVYKLGVILETSIIIQEGPHHASKLNIALEETKRSIIQAVFGEFREDLHNIRNLAYNFDFDGVLDVVRKLESRMFGE